MLLLVAVNIQPAVGNEGADSNMTISDYRVEDQNHRTLNFYTDLVKNKTVAINFIFTRCTSSCPLSMAIFRQAQKQLGKRPVQFITISIDPGNDTPERLLEFSKKFDAAPNWHFITGEKQVIDRILKQFDVFTTNRNDHTNIVIVGNDAKSHWQRLYGFPQADEILAMLKKVADVRSAIK
jgi:protein SCO1/2